MRHRVAAIRRVQEERAGFAVVMRVGDDLVEQVARPHRAPDLPVARVHQREVGVGLNRLHKGVGDADGDVEVADVAFFFLARHELLDIGVIDLQHGHIRPTSRAALSHLAERDVVHLQEADRSRGDARARRHRITLGTQPREGKAIPAAGLLDQRRVAQGLKDAVGPPAHVIRDGEDKARGELAQRRARAGEGGRIGEEAQAGEQRVEALFRGRRVIAVAPVRLGHGVCHAAEHALDRLGGLAVQPSAEIAFVQNLPAVIR